MQDDPATDVIGYLRSVQKQLADMEARVAQLEKQPDVQAAKMMAALDARVPDPKAQVQAADPEPKAKDRG